MWSDNEADVDLLGYKHLETGVLTILKDESLLPVTVGIYGDWGSGKSSLLRMVKDRLEKDASVLVLSFNGWLFEGYEDAKTALMGSIVDEIISRRTLTKEVKKSAKALGLKLLKKIKVFKLLGVGARAGLGFMTAGPVGAGASLAVDGVRLASDVFDAAQKEADAVSDMSLEDLQKGLEGEAGTSLRRSIRDFRNDFEELLRETDIKTLVVLIDDLDRCSPDTIIETLEAIKLFLFVPRTAFVIGADERLVQYAVRRRFPELPGERVDVGRDYLEKLIQFAVRVPPLGQTEMETYINLLFASRSKNQLKPGEFEKAVGCVVDCDADSLLSQRFNIGIANDLFESVPKDLTEGLALSQQIAPVLASQLTGNPRQCKRFLNLLLLRIVMAESRKVKLQKRVLAKLMLLEYFRNSSFRELATAQAIEQGKPKAVKDAEENAEHANSKRSSPNLKQLKASDSEKVADWLNDEWIIQEWLPQEPPLAGVDLRPYFFFARDKLGPLGAAAQRLSSQAQEVLAALLHESEAVREGAANKAGWVSPGDAAAIFQELRQKVQEEENPTDENSALNAILRWTEARPELVSQLLIELEKVPVSNMPVWLPRQVREITKAGSHAAAGTKLLQRWQSNATKASLKTAINQALKP